MVLTKSDAVSDTMKDLLIMFGSAEKLIDAEFLAQFGKPECAALGKKHDELGKKLQDLVDHANYMDPEGTVTDLISEPNIFTLSITRVSPVAAE